MCGNAVISGAYCTSSASSANNIISSEMLCTWYHLLRISTIQTFLSSQKEETSEKKWSQISEITLLKHLACPRNLSQSGCIIKLDINRQTYLGIMSSLSVITSQVKRHKLKTSQRRALKYVPGSELRTVNVE